MTWSSCGWRRVGIVVAALLGMVVTASLGRWQLSRAAQKEALQVAMQAREQAPALDGATLAQPLSPDAVPALLHRAVTLRGQWMPTHTLYLDNRQMGGKSGFFVLTPLRLSGSDTVVMVLRGWAPRNFIDRTALPPVVTPEGPVQVDGRVAERPPGAYALGPEQGGRIRQNLDLNAFRVESGLALAPLIVQQTGAPSEGLSRDWPAPAFGIEKHYGYAFQWFGLCLLIALLFLWFQVVRPIYRSSRG